MTIRAPQNEETRWIDKHGPPPGMEAKRTADAKLRQEQARLRVPEANESKPLAYFEISRYIKGNFCGLFVVKQLLTEDEKGKHLKKPVEKVVAEGVDIVVAMSSLETALRKRAFR